MPRVQFRDPIHPGAKNAEKMLQERDALVQDIQANPQIPPYLKDFLLRILDLIL